MERRVIQIDEERCNGCGLCAQACAEGAIGMVNGKARLLSDECCDGLGNCLPACPQDAIHFIIREAEPFNEAAVERRKRQRAGAVQVAGCPGSAARQMRRQASRAGQASVGSQLDRWPVQIKLSPTSLGGENLDLLIAADCSAYAYGNFHNDFMADKVTLIGCPKLDEGDYAEKLTEILRNSDVRSVVVARMEVPCCGGIEAAVKRAAKECGRDVPVEVVTISTDGRVLKQER